MTAPKHPQPAEATSPLDGARIEVAPIREGDILALYVDQPLTQAEADRLRRVLRATLDEAGVRAPFVVLDPHARLEVLRLPKAEAE